MDRKELKGKVLDFEKFNQLEEQWKVLQNKVNEDLEAIKRVKNALSEEIERFIENLLEGKEVEGKRVSFVMEDYRKPWWIYNFGVENDGNLEIILGDTNNQDPIYYKFLYDFESGVVLLQGRIC